ncbi:hypothetical protein TcYC6_0041520 [Trypanosoma cruzi]|uniref:Endonuclease-reverse transcriptase/Reverse transcriptase (RNA-dependent DNA polymerase) n=1 Tax=Trypanosoma cruzi TaxID=5693 RepID=A0A7J6XHW4_TRYCR|nr:hypothetical protein ECC02_013619 [Trypanosoma cruzi]KAF8303620.1 hypothetical protein TcYC6_0041520 [Trypanosoma cruzi]
MDFGLANDPAQATRITHRNFPSPDVAAYRVLRVTHWQSTHYMDSDHCLISYSVGMDDGIPRPANTLPRREKAISALRKADWPAFTSLCETLLAAASTWLNIRSGIVRAAERHIPRGSRDSPKQSGQTKWNKPSPPQKQHTKHTHRLARRQPASSRIHPKKGRNGIKPYAVASLCFWKPARKNLELHPAQTGDIFAAWRRRTLIPWNRLCSALIFGPRLCSASATGKCAFPSFCAGLTCHITLYCCCCCYRTPLPLGDWEMDRPLTPYELDVTIRDSSLGSAPGHDNMLNEFLHHLVPVARGTLRTMIHNSFANGSLPSSWNTVDTIPIPNPGKIHAAQRVTDLSRYSLLY